jgi:predicted RNA-binding Zn-ribbon protein involved in translation (DUF1610 family)
VFHSAARLIQEIAGEWMISATIPNELLTPFKPVEQVALREEYAALAELAVADCGLDHLLSRFLAHAVRLFGATGGAIWLRAPGETKPSIRAGDAESPAWQAVSLERELLIRHAISRTKSYFLHPRGTGHSRKSPCNPTDSFVLLGPVDSQGDRIGVVELVLGRRPAHGTSPAEQRCCANWLDHLTSFLRQGIENRFLGNLSPLQPALVNLAATREEIENYQRAIRVSLEITLNCYAGSSFGSLNNNRTFTKTVQELLDSNGLRVECPECGSPAILRCQAAGNARTGVFLYDHYLHRGRTFHGGPTTFPKLKLVSKPPRRAAE